MNRRDFIVGGSAGLGAVVPNSLSSGAMARWSVPNGRTFHILGVPLRTGSLYPGNENDAQAYREVNLLARLQAVGCMVNDDGDVTIPSYLPHHSIPPIRSWPGPRIAWDCINERITPYLQQPGHVPLLIGCDCSIVVGTTQALVSTSGKGVHVLYIDGHFDDAPPDSEHCQSAASLAVWFLTNASPFWTGPVLQSSQVTVIGWSSPSKSKQSGLGSVSLAEVRRLGPQETARQILAGIPASAAIVLHLDIDVFEKQEMPAAYFPHLVGLNLSEGKELLAVLLRDPRIRIIEVSEYASLRDLDRQWVGKLVDLLAESLKA